MRACETHAVTKDTRNDHFHNDEKMMVHGQRILPADGLTLLQSGQRDLNVSVFKLRAVVPSQKCTPSRHRVLGLEACVIAPHTRETQQQSSMTFIGRDGDEDAFAVHSSESE